MTRFDIHTTSDTPASPGADLGPKWDDESGGDWPVREGRRQLTVTIDHDAAGHHERRASCGKR